MRATNESRRRWSTGKWQGAAGTPVDRRGVTPARLDAGGTESPGASIYPAVNPLIAMMSCSSLYYFSGRHTGVGLRSVTTN